MMDSLYIAWRYVTWNRGKTLVLIASITTVAFLPLALQALLNESERQLRTRALDTPLLLGAAGSALDLVMSSLYFDDEVPARIDMRATAVIDDSGLAYPVPLYVRFMARGAPVVGTTLDYFEFRGLQLAQGRLFGLLGEAVIGADVASRLGIGVGDSLVSSPENLFDIAGVYPLKMIVAGVLADSHSPDDRAVFVDVKTAWVIEGLGHGHQDLAKTADSSVILKQGADTVTANARLVQYTEITPDNIDRFHFHGSAADYPLTALLVVPDDDKAAARLRGRFLDDSRYQLVKPDTVIDGLMESIFRIKQVIDAVIVIVAIATLLTIVLVFALSLRIRREELETIFRIGCSRMTTARLLAAEILIIVTVSAVLCAGLLWLIQLNSAALVQGLILR
jgi:putative ABC transport system permease protein